ncbi:MAG: ankyrin repeat domain-containing protein [Polyangiaceae bacterium]|nr:ankyrin repeat domain-containing protein [Polyangiaceae bacterium]
MSTATDMQNHMQRYRDLWRLGLHFASLARGSRTKLKPAAIEPVRDVLEPLGVRLNVGKLATEEGRDATRTTISAAVARVHGSDAAPIFSLAWAAADVRPWTEVEPGIVPDQIPPIGRDTSAAAQRFLTESAGLEEPVRSELAELRGWCEAVVSGWARSCELAEFGQLVAEVFKREDAAEAADPDADTPSSLQTATPGHVVEMIVLHHLVCSIAALRLGPSSMFRGDIYEGVHAHDDQSESHFIVGWNRHGIVGFGFHKYAAHEEIDTPEAERNPMRHLPGLPSALLPLAEQLSNQRGRWFTAGFYLTDTARRIEPGYSDDGSAAFKAFVGPPREALFKPPASWAMLRSLLREQAELARLLAKRAMAGGGIIINEESDVLLDPSWNAEGRVSFPLREDNLERVVAELAKVGLSWTVPGDVLATDRAAMKGAIEASIAEAMSADERALLDAACANDVGTIRQLLAKGVNINVRSVHGQFDGIGAAPCMPPLVIALCARAKEAAIALIEAGAELRFPPGRPALVAALQANDIDLVRLLLERSRVRAVAAFQVFWKAAAVADRAIVELLLDAGGLSKPPPQMDQMIAQLRQRGRGEIADLIEAHLAKR